MCGIVGIAGRSLEGRVDDKVREMTAKIKHRGPDSHSTYVSEDKMVAFGHARLEIVGGESAAQPMLQNNKGPLSIVFNGEVYNYRDLRSRLTSGFFTQSDTEVILNGYAEKGEAILDELNGQFAFAIYSPEKRKLFIARDRMGEKPLYYAHVDGKLYFASEIKALQSQLKLQPKVTPEFIEFETTVGKDTLFEGIFMLEPGEALSYYPAEDRLEIRKHWEFPFDKPALEGSERELIVTLDEALKESVSLRVPPDQPYGIMVSGGLDSSTLALLCSAVRKPGFLFMTRFPGMPVQYDEAGYAREVAKAVNVPLVEITPTADDFRDFMPDVLYHLDQPMASAALLPAYMIGMVLAGTVGKDHVLIRRLRTLTFGLLTPFYFIRAGSYVSVPALIAAPAAIFVLFLGKMITKILGVYPATKAYKYAQKEGIYTTLLMSTGLTFGSIAALFGLSHNIIDQQQYSILVFVVIGSAVVPTLIANAFFMPKYLLPKKEKE